MYQNPQNPWSNWYGQPPPPNTIFVPMPAKKKHKNMSLKTIGDQIEYLEKLKEQLKGKDKKSGPGELKPGEFNADKFLKAWGMLCFFGPPVGFMYYEFFKYLTH